MEINKRVLTRYDETLHQEVLTQNCENVYSWKKYDDLVSTDILVYKFLRKKPVINMFLRAFKNSKKNIQYNTILTFESLQQWVIEDLLTYTQIQEMIIQHYKIRINTGIIRGKCIEFRLTKGQKDEELIKQGKKYCPGCCTVLLLEKFGKSCQTTDGFAYRCKECKKKECKVFLDNNPGYKQKYRQRYRQKYSRTIKKQIQDRKDIVNNIKSKNGCEMCNETNHIVLVFHHENPKTKMFNISEKMSIGLFKLFDEIEKCIVLCANCHRKVHAGLIDVNHHKTIKIDRSLYL